MMGLSDVYSHYLDAEGNKFFDTHDSLHGTFIRQVQTITGECYDCSDGELFEQALTELGLKKSDVFFRVYDNIRLFKYHIYGKSFYRGWGVVTEFVKRNLDTDETVLTEISRGE